VSDALDDVDHDQLARLQPLAQFSHQLCPTLAQPIEVRVEATKEAAGRAVGCELRVLPTAKVELKLGTSDGYKSRVWWLA